jgi:hypothetical protein
VRSLTMNLHVRERRSDGPKAGLVPRRTKFEDELPL